MFSLSSFPLFEKTSLSSNPFLSILKGFLIGATMLIPGMSGGSMAMILGIYDELIFAVSSFKKNARHNFFFLLSFSAGAGMGMLLCSKPISWLLIHYPSETLYFFFGAVCGSIPSIEKKSSIEKISFDVLFYLLLGLLVVIGMERLPEDLFSRHDFDLSFDMLSSQTLLSFFITRALNNIRLIFAGLLSSIPLILPGISFSHFLLTLGLYEKLLEAINTFDFLFLLFLGLGLLLGLLLFTRLLEYWMKQHPKSAYFTILGFVLGSALVVFPGIPSQRDFLACLIPFVVGFLIPYTLTNKNCSIA